MKAVATVKSEKGFYCEMTVFGSTFQALMSNLVSSTMKLPDEIDGVKVYEWTSMTIEVENSK